MLLGFGLVIYIMLQQMRKRELGKENSKKLYVPKNENLKGT